MFVVAGITGNTGSAAAEALLASGEDVFRISAAAPSNSARPSPAGIAPKPRNLAGTFGMLGFVIP